MKRQNKTGAAVKLSAVIVISSMMLGACAKTVQNQEIPAATYMGGNDTITGVCKDLDSAGASHVECAAAGRLVRSGRIEGRYRQLYGRLGAES